MAHIDFAWELGGHTGHVTTLMPIARSLQARGHEVRFLLKDLQAGADLEGAASIPREGAPIWVGPVRHPNPLNFGEILINFGYGEPDALRRLIDAWRERLSGTALVVANVAPAAHLAALTLGIPSLEISQGFHVPPPAMPSPPLRDWVAAPREPLEAADIRVLGAINGVLAAYGVPSLATIGELFAGRALLLTYPELDIYPERGPADYFGVPRSGEGDAAPDWPAGSGPRVFGYLYNYYAGLAPLLDALEQLRAPTLMFCRDIDPALARSHQHGSVQLCAEPMAVSRVLPDCDVVVCHGSHQMTAQALLAGKPVLMLPTQLEQFLIMRRVVRQGAGLGISPDTPDADFGAAIAELCRNPAYAGRAQEFARRYESHDRDASLATMIERCESALRAVAKAPSFRDTGSAVPGGVAELPTPSVHPPVWEFRSALPGAVWPAIPDPAHAAVLSLLFQFERSQWLPADALHSLQMRQLGALLRHAWETVPYYRGRWGTAPDATRFSQLPLLMRRDLQDHFASLNSGRVPAEHGAITELSTSGSTGTPVRVKKTGLSSLLWNAFTLRDHLWHGRDLRGKLAVIRSKISASQAESWGQATLGLVETGPAVMQGIDASVATLLEWLQREQPDYLLTYATLAGELARASLERGIRLPRLREVRTFAECLSTDTREACRRAWGQKVTDIYSTVEVGYIALQCPLYDHYHVQSEGVLLEVLDDDGEACAPGRIGRVVVTDLHNFATPLIRYAVGDLAEPGETCSCGRGLPVLRRILGRERNALVTRSGERYWPYFGGAAGIMDAAPVRQFQFVQKDYDLVVARLVSAGPLSPGQEDGLRKRVLAFLPPGLRLEFQYCDSIARSAGGKFEEFVSEVAPPGAA